MNHTRLPKVLLQEWARQDKQGTKGDRVRNVGKFHSSRG